jgi:hypothetical protein
VHISTADEAALFEPGPVKGKQINWFSTRLDPLLLPGIASH